MRFRARLVDIGCIHQLTKIFVTVAKMCKSCALCLSEHQLTFIILDKISSGGASMFCEINQEGFFDEFRIEGKDERNQIYLEVNPDNLVRCMKSAQNAQAVKIKLTRKQTPCLTFEVALPSLTMHTRSILHDVPVGLVPSRLWDEFLKPLLPDYDISVSMPAFKTLKAVIERMKNLSSTVILAATPDKKFSLKVQTEAVTATTHFPSATSRSDLDLTSTQSQRSQAAAVNDSVEARVDLHKLASFLHAQQHLPDVILCNIVEGQTVHLSLGSNDLSILFCMPALNT